jgi:hypothetical protein
MASSANAHHRQDRDLPDEGAFRWVLLFSCSTKSLQAENLFLRRQLALFLERGLDVTSRISLAACLLRVAPGEQLAHRRQGPERVVLYAIEAEYAIGRLAKGSDVTIV